MNASRFQELLQRYQNGEAVAAEILELEACLRGDADYRRLFVESCFLEVQLHKVFGIAPGAETRDPLAIRFRRVAGRLSAAAVFLAVGAMLFQVLGRGEFADPEIVSGQARIAGLPAARVPSGASFDVVGDMPLVIRLGDGSEAEFRPTSQAVLHGRRDGRRQVVELVRGFGRFKVAPGEGQFRVDTPAGAVTALGTEFWVALRGRAANPPATQRRAVLVVAVQTGTVRVDAGAKSKTLSAGQRLTVGEDGQQHDHDDEDNNHDGEKDDGRKHQNGEGGKNN